MLEAGFAEYFGTGRFFPKPADIKEIIRVRRASTFVQTYVPIDREKTRQEQETSEWKASAEKARRKLAELAGRTFDPVQNSKETIKAQAEQIAQKRQGVVPSPSSSTGK